MNKAFFNKKKLLHEWTWKTCFAGNLLTSISDFRKNLGSIRSCPVENISDLLRSNRLDVVYIRTRNESKLRECVLVCRNGKARTTESHLFDLKPAPLIMEIHKMLSLNVLCNGKSRLLIFKHVGFHFLPRFISMNMFSCIYDFTC